METRPAPPSVGHVFDWHLVVSLVLLVLIAVMSCDMVNRSLDRALAPPKEYEPRTEVWKPGYTEEVDITLITKDYSRLACAHDGEIEGVRCEFDSKKHSLGRSSQGNFDDNNLKIIQPYRTAVGNHLVLVAGLWATPDIALRHHEENPRGVKEKKLRRFVARCRLRFIGEFAPVSVRWNPTQKWYDEKKGPVAIAEACHIPK